jgi:malonate transporter
MTIASLILPVFGVILTGWLAGAVGYLPRTLAGPLAQFAYNVAMPALVFLTIAKEPIGSLLDGGFLAAFGGGSMICFAAVLLIARAGWHRGIGASGMLAAAATMTNTGCVALPILQALYGTRGILPAAIATVFIAVVMLPALLILLELERRGRSDKPGTSTLAKQIILNPVMISTLLGLAWSVAGLPLPAPIATYAGMFGDALTACALFAIGLGLSLTDLRGDFAVAMLLSVIKLVVVPLVVYGLCVAGGLTPFSAVAAVVCAAVPTAKTAYVVAGEYGVEESMVAATVSLTTLLSVASLLAWLYALT